MNSRLFVSVGLLGSCIGAHPSDPVKRWLGCKTADCRAKCFLYPAYPKVADLEADVKGVEEMMSIYELEFGPSVDCRASAEPSVLYSCGGGGGNTDFVNLQLAKASVRSTVVKCHPPGRPAYYLVFKTSLEERKLVQVGFGLSADTPGASAAVQRAVQRVVNEVINPRVPTGKQIGTMPNPEDLLKKPNAPR